MSGVIKFSFLSMNKTVNRKLSLPIIVSLKFFISYKQNNLQINKQEEYAQLLP